PVFAWVMNLAVPLGYEAGVFDISFGGDRTDIDKRVGVNDLLHRLATSSIHCLLKRCTSHRYWEAQVDIRPLSVEYRLNGLFGATSAGQEDGRRVNASVLERNLCAHRLLIGAAQNTVDVFARLQQVRNRG